jgi:hypothetical protein
VHNMETEASLVLVVGFVSLCALSCNDLGDRALPPPRIIPGVSIDGIQLGYTREKVELVLGQPVVTCISVLASTDTSFILRDASVFARSSGIPPLDCSPLASSVLQWKNGEAIGSSVLCGEFPIASPFTLVVCCQ